MSTSSARPDHLHSFATVASGVAADLDRAAHDAQRAAATWRAAEPTAALPISPGIVTMLAGTLSGIGAWVRDVAWAFSAADSGSGPRGVAVADESTLAAELVARHPGAAEGDVLEPLRTRIATGERVAAEVLAHPLLQRGAVLERMLDELTPAERADPALAAALLSSLSPEDIEVLVHELAPTHPSQAPGHLGALADLADLLALASRTWDQPSVQPLDHDLIAAMLDDPQGRNALRDLVAAATIAPGAAFLSRILGRALLDEDGDADDAVAAEGWFPRAREVVSPGADADEALLLALADNPVNLVPWLGADGADAADVGRTLVERADSTAAQDDLARALDALLALPELSPTTASTARTTLLIGVARGVAERDEISAGLAEVLARSVIDDPAAWQTLAGQVSSTADEATPADRPLARIAAQHDALVGLLAALDVEEQILLRQVVRGGDHADAARLALDHHDDVVAALERGAEAADVPAGAWAEVFAAGGYLVGPLVTLLPAGPAIRSLARPIAEAALDAVEQALVPEGTSAEEVRSQRLARQRNAWLAVATDLHLGGLVDWDVPGSPIHSPDDLGALGRETEARAMLEAWAAAQPTELRVIVADLLPAT